MSQPKVQTPQIKERPWVVVESPIPPTRALMPRPMLAMVATSSVALVTAIWYVAIVGGAGAMSALMLPLTLLQGSAAATQNQMATHANPPANVLPVLQSRSSEPVLLVGTRADGRAALEEAPAALVIYVPANYYPQPASERPPTVLAAQRAANIVQSVSARNAQRALAQAKLLRTEQPQYAARLAADLQGQTLNWPRTNTLQQLLVELDPTLATQTQAQAQTQTQAQAQTQTTVQLPTQNQTNAPAVTPPNRVNPADKANRVYPFVMATVPAYAKIPMGMNEGTLQVNTLVAPTPAFLLNQAKIRGALCEVGNSEVVAVYDAIPQAWELKTTFNPRDPVRWFGVKDSAGQVFYLPNYFDAAHDMQVGERFVVKSGCQVELVRK